MPFGGGGVAGVGPGPEVLALGAGLAGIAGLVAIRMLNGRRRRDQPLEPARLAAAAAMAPNPGGGTWRNLSLDDDASLPRWLRASGRQEPEDAPKPQFGCDPVDAPPTRAFDALPAVERVPAIELPAPDEPALELPARDEPPVQLDPEAEARDQLGHRGPLTFAEPVGASAMRLRVGRPGVELLAEPFQAEARVLAELGPGDEVEILELEDPWVKVQTPLGDSGWIDAAALSAT
jgi:hypothetical protein